ncbi:hypothetical protein L2E82_08107 [Cichorium intybus]|uniref:Uncharacterized protein n=1 Tax=Cichorium intybus TaxID=13427 RepID=A0ACB9G5B7_CICIN|nr:hypothetical protein L2E82_08107 [Cichorium intybus]
MEPSSAWNFGLPRRAKNRTESQNVDGTSEVGIEEVVGTYYEVDIVEVRGISEVGVEKLGGIETASSRANETISLDMMIARAFDRKKLGFRTVSRERKVEDEEVDPYL